MKHSVILLVLACTLALFCISAAGVAPGTSDHIVNALARALSPSACNNMRPADYMTLPEQVHRLERHVKTASAQLTCH